MRFLLTLSPYAAIPVCQWVGTHFPSPLCLIIAYLVMFAASFASLYQLHILIFGHRPRFF